MDMPVGSPLALPSGSREKINKFVSYTIPNYKSEKEPDYRQGELVFENFLARRCLDEYQHSDPVIVNGFIYRFCLYPKIIGSSSQIELSVERNTIECLNLEPAETEVF